MESGYFFISSFRKLSRYFYSSPLKTSFNLYFHKKKDETQSQNNNNTYPNVPLNSDNWIICNRSLQHK